MLNQSVVVTDADGRTGDVTAGSGDVINTDGAGNAVPADCLPASQIHFPEVSSKGETLVRCEITQSVRILIQDIVRYVLINADFYSAGSGVSFECFKSTSISAQ